MVVGVGGASKNNNERREGLKLTRSKHGSLIRLDQFFSGPRAYSPPSVLIGRS